MRPADSHALGQLGGIFARLAGWGGSANWGRWGQVSSGERSVVKEGGGEDREACQSQAEQGGRQMSGQLPQLPAPRILRLPPPRAPDAT